MAGKVMKVAKTNQVFNCVVQLKSISPVEIFSKVFPTVPPFPLAEYQVQRTSATFQT